MPSELHLDEEKHIYTLNGRRLVSVTQALSLVDDRRKDPFYLNRGRLVHLACELWDRDELDEDTVDPQILPRLEAWKKFRADTGFIPDRIEEKYFHPLYLYAFKFDVHGSLNGSEVMIDRKSSPHRIDALQGAAYSAGLEAQAPPITCKKAFDIYLGENGTYKLAPIPNLRSHFMTFLAILTAYRWKEGL